MSNHLAPCVAIIGPANSGKTSILNLLDESLKAHPDEPLSYVVKASPDGDGRYTYYSPGLRAANKGRWGPVTVPTIVEWVRSARRRLELVLVDVGGSREAKARDGNALIFAECTHALVLARQFEDPAGEAAKGMDAWAADAVADGLSIFARIDSRIRTGEPYFDPESRRGLFRGDAAKPHDQLNHPLIEGLTESLVDLRMHRGTQDYFNMSRRWNDADLANLAGRLGQLQSGVRDDSAILLGGAGPIFAYAAAFHHARDVSRSAVVRVFDPKVPSGQVQIPDPKPGADVFPPDELRLEWVVSGGVLTLKVAVATEDRFLGPQVLDRLAALSIPPPPAPLTGATVEIDGPAPIWLHLTLSNWVRQQGAARIGHFDGSFNRIVWVWPCA